VHLKELEVSESNGYSGDHEMDLGSYSANIMNFTVFFSLGSRLIYIVGSSDSS
jgi:hypothetical protein